MGKRLMVDVVVLAVYLVTANPAITGIPAHEWLGLGLLLVFVAHLAPQVDWAAGAARDAFRRRSRKCAGNLILDVLILVALAACAVSGVLVSGTVLPTFGLYAEGYFFWDPLHAASAKVLLALLVVHVALHAKWIAGAIGKKKGASDGERIDA